MTVPMLRVLPPPWDFRMMATPNGGSNVRECFNSDKYDSIRKLEMAQLQPPRNPNKPFTSFRINDILNSSGDRNQSSPQTHKQSNRKVSPCQRDTLDHRNLVQKLKNVKNNGRYYHCKLPRDAENIHGLNHVVAQHTRIVRPWDASPPPGRTSEASSEADEEQINVDEYDNDSKQPVSRLKDVSPLDALMEMANKTFQGLETSEAADAKRREQAFLFGGKHSTPKKRRKSRTAFSNQQIYELEKRFLYQKYLTPADRDEIAQNLGLTNAQVITWFQNRRAKLKRDLEELKNDVVATKHLSIKSGSSDNEFSIDSDSDSAVSGGRSSDSPPKLCCSKTRSLEVGQTNGVTSAAQNGNGAEERCESPDEIIVDDVEEEDNDKHFVSEW